MASKPYLPLFTKLPESRESRWRLVREFIDAWYAPLKADDGISDQELEDCEDQLGFRFPTALREWYLLAGKRKDVWSTQDRLFLPNDVVRTRHDVHPYYRRFDGTLVFYVENQGCEYWVIRDGDLPLDDPPAYRIAEDPREFCATVSAFAIQTLLREVIWRGPVRGWGGDFPIATVREVQEILICCDLPTVYWSALEPIRFYEGTNIVMVTHGDAWIYIAARDRTACEFIPQQIRAAMEWDERQQP